MPSTASPPIRILLADDDELIRYGLQAVFQGETGIEVVGEAGDGRTAIALARTLQPDIVLMDIGMPLVDGVAATAEICRAWPHVKVVMLTTYAEDRYVQEAIKHGAAGYLLKNTPPQDLIHLIQTAYRGYLQFSPALGAQLCPPQVAAAPIATDCCWQGATPREREVIELIAEGANNREIAQALCITVKTVKNHVSNILSRMGMRDRTQLAIWANTAGQISPYSLSA